MNDERPIEKLLHRYAKKRRDDAGAPMELHPATRRMLRGEVARRFHRRGKSSESEPTAFAQILKLWRGQLIWAVPVLIVLGVGIWAMVGPGGRSDREFSLAKNISAPTADEAVSAFGQLETRSSAVAPASSEAAPQVTMTSVGNAPASTKPGSSEAAATLPKEPTLKAESDRVAASERAPVLPADQFHSQTLVAKGGSDEISRTAGDEKKPGAMLALSPPARNDSVENFESVRQNYLAANTSRLAAAPASRPADLAMNESARYYRTDALNEDNRDKAQAYSQTFMNRAPASGYGKKSKSGGIATVLANFQVVQSGNQLRVIDADGSTYLGEMDLPAREQVVTVAVADKTTLGLNFTDNKPAAERSQAAATAANQAGVQNYFNCRVAGTNRTLNQAVVFSWNFIPASNELAVAQTKPSSRTKVSLQVAPVQQFPNLLNNSFINGRAQLGGAKEIEVNAVPVSP